MTGSIRKFLTFAAFVAITSVAAGTASAGHLDFTLDTTLSGTTVPNGSTLSAVITDIGANQVSIKMDATNLSSTGPQFISGWGFNIDPSLTITSGNLTSVFASSSGGVSIASNFSTTAGSNNGAFNPPSAGSFDLVYDWAGSNHTFQNGSIITFNVTYTGSGTFNAQSFNFATTDGNKAYTLTKIQGFGSSGELGTADPGTYHPDTGPTVPEPASLAMGLMATVLLCGVVARRRQVA